MNHGKHICNELRAVRRRIADENGIALEVPECTYHGECPGTCPRCEAEVRYLEDALANRLRLGKVATVAGMALGLAATANAQSAIDSTKVQPQRDTTRCKQMQRLESPSPLVPNDSPQMVAIRRLRSQRPLAGEVIAEIQVILGGTPASIGTPWPNPTFYEEKPSGPRVKVSNK